jgi:predicted TIM-barrel fold metal-dependent hydrolase
MSTVVDTDAHFFESLDELVNYFDEPWKTYLGRDGAPKDFFLSRSTGDRSAGGRIKRDNVGYYEEPMTPEEVPGMMDFLGVDKTIVISHLMLAYPAMQADDTRAASLSKGAVDYLLERVVAPSDGIYTFLPVPYHDPEASVELIDDYAGEPGIVGVCFITAGAEPPLGNRRYDSIYEATEAAGMPAVFHTGGSGIDEYHTRGYEKFIETHTLGFLESNMSQLVSLVIQGVPEKFPDMDIVFQEAGILWVSSLMHRIDAEYLKRQSEAPLLTKRPSEYMRQFYFGTQPLEFPDNLDYYEAAFREMGGPANLMYASDYPHWDFDRPTRIRDIPFLSEAERHQVLGGNAIEVFGL